VSSRTLAAAPLTLFFPAGVSVSMGVEISRLVSFVRMVRSRLLHGARRRSTGVPVAVWIQVAGNVAVVRMMWAWLFDWLSGHHSLLESTIQFKTARLGSM